MDSTQQSGGFQQKGAISQLWGTASLIRGRGSQIRGVVSDIRREPPQFNACSMMLLNQWTRQPTSLPLHRPLHLGTSLSHSTLNITIFSLPNMAPRYVFPWRACGPPSNTWFIVPIRVHASQIASRLIQLFLLAYVPNSHTAWVKKFYPLRFSGNISPHLKFYTHVGQSYPYAKPQNFFRFPISNSDKVMACQARSPKGRKIFRRTL